MRLCGGGGGGAGGGGLSGGERKVHLTIEPPTVVFPFSRGLFSPCSVSTEDEIIAFSCYKCTSFVFTQQRARRHRLQWAYFPVLPSDPRFRSGLVEPFSTIAAAIVN